MIKDILETIGKWIGWVGLPVLLASHLLGLFSDPLHTMVALVILLVASIGLTCHFWFTNREIPRTVHVAGADHTLQTPQGTYQQPYGRIEKIGSSLTCCLLLGGTIWFAVAHWEDFFSIAEIHNCHWLDLGVAYERHGNIVNKEKKHNYATLIDPNSDDLLGGENTPCLLRFDLWKRDFWSSVQVDKITIEVTDYKPPSTYLVERKYGAIDDLKLFYAEIGPELKAYPVAYVYEGKGGKLQRKGIYAFTITNKPMSLLIRVNATKEGLYTLGGTVYVSYKARTLPLPISSSQYVFGPREKPMKP